MVDDIQNSGDTASVFDDLANNPENSAEAVEDLPTDQAEVVPESSEDSEAIAAVSDAEAAGVQAEPTKAPSIAQPARPRPPVEKTEISHLTEEISNVSDYIKDMETLVIAKVLHKIHQSYYKAWTGDLRHAYSLIARLNRRRNEIQSKRDGRASPDLKTG